MKYKELLAKKKQEDIHAFMKPAHTAFLTELKKLKLDDPTRPRRMFQFAPTLNKKFPNLTKSQANRILRYWMSNCL